MKNLRYEIFNLKLKMEILQSFFYKIILDRKIPHGYHKLTTKREPPNFLVITIESQSTLSGINILIPYLKFRYISLLEELLKYLRNYYEEYDFLVDSVNFGNSTVFNVKLKYFRSHLNLYQIPSDIYSEIIKYLNTCESYFNLAEVIKLRLYPELLGTLIKRIPVPNGSVDCIIDEDGTPMMLYIDINRNNITETYYNRDMQVLKMTIKDLKGNPRVFNDYRESIFKKWDSSGNLIYEQEGGIKI